MRQRWNWRDLSRIDVLQVPLEGMTPEALPQGLTSGHVPGVDGLHHGLLVVEDVLVLVHPHLSRPLGVPSVAVRLVGNGVRAVGAKHVTHLRVKSARYLHQSYTNVRNKRHLW